MVPSLTTRVTSDKGEVYNAAPSYCSIVRLSFPLSVTSDVHLLHLHPTVFTTWGLNWLKTGFPDRVPLENLLAVVVGSAFTLLQLV